MHKTMSVMPGGYFNKCTVERFGTQKKWTQSDLKFCENEGSIRSKTNEKGGQLDRKLRRKLMKNGEN